MKRILLIIILFGALFSSCRRDQVFDGKATLEFSTDTVFFDTVFTTTGSLTERLKIYNPYDKTVEISSIHVENGTPSNFKLNADGFTGKEVRDLEIPPFDSIYVFVEVTVDPNGGNGPMILEENLVVQTSQNIQGVKLVAWGQDAYFYPSLSFGDSDGDGIGDQWELPTDKPIVFYGYSIVDTGAILTIPCGARVHFHSNSGLIVGDNATLQILGCENNPVIVQGDRLEDYFEDVPGQWGQIFGGIYLTQTSKDNVIRNAIIKNGTVGITIDSNINENPTLLLENTQILNMSFIGIRGQDSRIVANNTVVANCGDHAVALQYGGDYEFNHCTFANYWSGNPRSKATLLLNNHFKDRDGATRVRDFNATFTNTIVHGSLDEEVEIDNEDGEDFLYYFDHCALKRDTNELEDPEHYADIILNPSSPVVDGVTKNPLFDDVSMDYRLFQQSRAVNKGVVTSLLADLEGSARDATPDIGAYEFPP